MSHAKMKLVSLSSNKEEIFPRIAFHKGLNVVFARVTNPASESDDSHNLGKSFLIKVIDFALMSKVDRNHPFRENAELFDDFIFYLEIETVNKQYITIQRCALDNRDTRIHVSEKKGWNYKNSTEEDWRYRKLSFEKAKAIIDELLDLEALKPYRYRKGLGYLLRDQSDYNEVFKVTPFRYGSDQGWKPFLAYTLGFNRVVIEEKYDLDNQIKNLRREQKIIEKEAGSKSEQYDSVRGEIELRTQRIKRIRKEVESFSFREIEQEISQTIVGEIENELASLNERRYLLDREIQEIEKSLEYKTEMSMDKIKEVFEEVNISFPDQLSHSYDELISFNRRLSVGRMERLSQRKNELLKENSKIEISIEKLDSKRQEALSIIRQKETLEKYKSMQRILILQERELSELEQSFKQLDRATTVQTTIEDKKQEVVEKRKEIRVLVRSQNEVYSTIRQLFSKYVESVLGVQALLSVNPNSHGNLEFNVKTLDRNVLDRETTESQGNTYKKILCACFDLSILSFYSSRKFYRFVYHDGIFEGLDNRKKNSLLRLVRRIAQEKDIQYILTVIDSDLPRNELDDKLFFTRSEIVRELSDKGEEGRLFRMRAF